MYFMCYHISNFCVMSSCISSSYPCFFCGDNMIVYAEAINTEVPATDDPKVIDGGDVLTADIPPRSGNHF